MPDWLSGRPELLLAPALLLTVLAAWEATVSGGVVNRHLFPAPSSIAGSLTDGLSSGAFLQHAAITLTQASIGFGIAVSAGILMAALIAEFRTVERVVYPYLIAIQTMPKIALAPLFIIWFGFGMPSKIVVATIISFFPVLVNTIAGLKNTDQGRLDVLRSLGASRWSCFALAKLPGALPYVFSGVSVAVVFSLTGTIVGEFVGATGGLGFLILQANARMDIPQVFAILVVLGGIGVLAYGTLQAIRARLLFWAPRQELTRT